MILGRFDGIIFLIIFAVYVLMMVFQAMRARNNQEVVQLETMENEELMIMSYPKSLLCIVGMVQQQLHLVEILQLMLQAGLP